MKLLALDTSTEACSVALRVGDAVSVRRHPGAREQTAHVLPLVQALLAEAGIALRDLDAIACAHGPGAFTGVRVAVSVVQGLAYGARVPAIGVSTLAALALQARRRDGSATYILPALDARMGELYAGACVADADGLVTELVADRLVRPDDVVAGLPILPAGAVWTLIGSGWQAYPDLATQPGLPVSTTLAGEPDAVDVLALAARSLLRGATVPAEQLLPVYLRDTVAWKKLAEQGKP